MSRGSGDYVNLNHARTDDQRGIMQQIVDDSTCPFCPESLEKYHKQPILKKSRHWIVTTNQWPYRNTDAHYLLIARVHAETITELPGGAFEDLGEQIQDLVRQKKLTYGAVGMRFGDTQHTGATVSHLHVHLVHPSPSIPAGESVRFKMSK